MAKMFYSLEEAAQKLGVGEEQVKEMADSGDLQQFRDRDKLMFKRDQVDALAAEVGGGNELADLGPVIDSFSQADEDTDAIPLLDDDEQSAVASSPTTDTDEIDLITIDSEQPDLSAPGSDQDQQTDYAMQDDSEPDAFDASTSMAVSDSPDQTQIAPPITDDDDLALDLEQIGSGSGLLDLTRETDDTSLGADLLDEIYPADAGGSDMKMDTATASAVDHGLTSSSIFDGPIDLDISTSGLENLQGDIGEPSSVVPSEAMFAGHEEMVLLPTDYSGNGLAMGMLAVSLVSLFVTLVVMTYALTDVPSSVTATIAKSPGGYTFGLLFAAGLLGLAGWFFGRVQNR